MNWESLAKAVLATSQMTSHAVTHVPASRLGARHATVVLSSQASSLLIG